MCFSPEVIKLLEEVLASTAKKLRQKAEDGEADGIPPEGNRGTGEYGKTGDTNRAKVDGHGLRAALSDADRAKLHGALGQLAPVVQVSGGG